LAVIRGEGGKKGQKQLRRIRMKKFILFFLM